MSEEANIVAGMAGAGSFAHSRTARYCGIARGSAFLGGRPQEVPTIRQPMRSCRSPLGVGCGSEKSRLIMRLLVHVEQKKVKRVAFNGLLAGVSPSARWGQRAPPIDRQATFAGGSSPHHAPMFAVDCASCHDISRAMSEGDMLEEHPLQFAALKAEET